MTILDEADKLRRAQEKLEGIELERLIRAYARINDAAAERIDALVEKIVLEFEKTGVYPSKSQIQRMNRYKDLMTMIERELQDYEAFLRVELRTAGSLALAAGEKDSRFLIEYALQEAGAGRVALNPLNTAQIEKLVGFLSPDGPLYKRLGELSSWTAEQVANTILEGIGLGLNPKTTARMLTKTLTDGVVKKLGMALTDALRTMRTVQLWSYREASRATYVEHEDIVPGWVWYADLGGDVCMGCVAMHGTEHTNNETLDDHYNGHCTMLPHVLGAANPVKVSGERWFNAQPEAKQREMMGPGKYDAYKGGAFKFSELAKKHDDETYGSMTVETPLWELLGAEPPLRIDQDEE